MIMNSYLLVSDLSGLNLFLLDFILRYKKTSLPTDGKF